MQNTVHATFDMKNYFYYTLSVSKGKSTVLLHSINTSDFEKNPILKHWNDAGGSDVKLCGDSIIPVDGGNEGTGGRLRGVIGTVRLTTLSPPL